MGIFMKYNRILDFLEERKHITTNSFSYGKTAEVIQKSVGGYEIFQEDGRIAMISNGSNQRFSAFGNKHRLLRTLFFIFQKQALAAAIKKLYVTYTICQNDPENIQKPHRTYFHRHCRIHP